MPRQEDVAALNTRVGCLDITQLFTSNMKYVIVSKNDFTEKYNIEQINVVIFVNELYRFYLHMQHNRNNNIEFNYTDQTFKDLRIDYVLNNITEESFISAVIKRYKQRQYQAMIYNLQQIFITIIEDFFDKINFSVSKVDRKSSIIENELLDTFTSFFEFATYYNKQNTEITSLFGYRSCNTYFGIEKERNRFYMRIDHKTYKK